MNADLLRLSACSIWHQKCWYQLPPWSRCPSLIQATVTKSEDTAIIVARYIPLCLWHHSLQRHSQPPDFCQDKTLYQRQKSWEPLPPSSRLLYTNVPNLILLLKYCLLIVCTSEMTFRNISLYCHTRFWSIIFNITNQHWSSSSLLPPPWRPPIWNCKTVKTSFIYSPYYNYLNPW